MLLPITMTAAAACALIGIWLGIRVSQVRRAAGVAHGDGGHGLLVRRMRAHANFVENAPFFLILLLLLERAGGSAFYLWAAAIVFIGARLLHPFGMDRDGANPLRIAGIALSWSVIGALAVWTIALSYAQLAANQPERRPAPAMLKS